MRYFLDTEFYEEPGTIDLISIALVAEDGAEFYRGNNEHNATRAKAGNPWLLDNVYPHLPQDYEERKRFWLSRDRLRFELHEFFTHEERTGNVQPEIWGYFADYDWVAFCWIFGRMIELPPWMPRYCLDLKQWMRYLDVSRDELPEQSSTEHDALNDARWNKEVFEFLSNHEHTLSLGL